MDRLQPFATIALLCALVSGGCASGSAPDEGDGDGGAGSGAGSPGDPFDGYAHRRAVTVTGTVVAGYSLAVTLDHAALVAAGKSRADGADLRVATDADGTLAELDRVADPRAGFNLAKTVLWFGAPADGAASYFLYYGNADAGFPPADPAKIYLVWDDFEGAALDPAWTVSLLGDAEGSAEVVGGVLRVSGATGDIGGTADDGVLVRRELTGDFVADAELAAVGGSLGAAAKLGGLMVRQSEEPGSRFALMTIRQQPHVRLASVRPDDDLVATETELPVADEYPQLVRLQRLANEAVASYSDDGVSFIGLGGTANVGLTDPVLLGVPFANISGGTGHVDVAWLRIRRRVSPEPTVQLGDEEQLSAP